MSDNIVIAFEGSARTDEQSGHNICIGYGAGRQLTTGSHNTLVGHEAGDNLTTESDYDVFGQTIRNYAFDALFDVKQILDFIPVHIISSLVVEYAGQHRQHHYTFTNLPRAKPARKNVLYADSNGFLKIS